MLLCLETQSLKQQGTVLPYLLSSSLQHSETLFSNIRLQFIPIRLPVFQLLRTVPAETLRVIRDLPKGDIMR